MRSWQPDELISPAYLETQRTLHATPRGYGAKGHKWASTVAYLQQTFRAESILDYGCGGGGLMTALQYHLRLPARIEEYDPAIAGKDALPRPADLVICTDVLEHIEPNRLMTVLDHLRSLTQTAAFLVIALDPANKTLSDGRNAHLIQESPEWWSERVRAAGFRLYTDEQLATVPMPVHYSPEKRSKRWITVARPC